MGVGGVGLESYNPNLDPDPDFACVNSTRLLLYLFNIFGIFVNLFLLPFASFNMIKYS